MCSRQVSNNFIPIFFTILATEITTNAKLIKKRQTLKFYSEAARRPTSKIVPQFTFTHSVWIILARAELAEAEMEVIYLLCEKYA